MNKLIIAVIVVGVFAASAYMWRSKNEAENLSDATIKSSRLEPNAKRPSPRTEASASDKSTKVDTEASAPGWMRSGSAPNSAPTTVGPTAPVEDKDSVRLTRLQAAVARAQALQTKPNVTPAEAIQAIKEIETANGSPDLNGIRLDTLRQNLEVASQMKALSEEIQALQPAVEAKKPEALEAMQAKVKEIETLQGRLKTDFYARPQSTSSVATP